MAAVYGKSVRRILSENGCVFLRHGKGDHEIWKNLSTGVSFTVDAEIKSRHTANAIMKQAGIDYKF